ncbi:unnamed protein product, partial [Arctogadus glacialis]
MLGRSLQQSVVLLRDPDEESKELSKEPSPNLCVDRKQTAWVCVTAFSELPAHFSSSLRPEAVLNLALHFLKLVFQVLTCTHMPGTCPHHHLLRPPLATTSTLLIL